MKVVAILSMLFLAANHGFANSNFYYDEPEPEPRPWEYGNFYNDEPEPEPRLDYSNFYYDEPEPEPRSFDASLNPLCKDRFSSSCREYKNKQCDWFGDKYCKKTCGKCTKKPICKDALRLSCQNTKRKPCQKFPQLCPKTCNRCPKPKPKPTPEVCTDEFPSTCGEYENNQNQCDSYGNKYCKKTCGTCTETKKPPKSIEVCKDKLAYACLNADCRKDLYRTNCAKTCHICPKNEGCLKYDDQSTCTKASEYCTWDVSRTPHCIPKVCVNKYPLKICTTNGCGNTLLKENCAKSCGVCKCRDIAGYCENEELKKKICLSYSRSNANARYESYRQYYPYCCATCKKFNYERLKQAAAKKAAAKKAAAEKAAAEKAAAEKAAAEKASSKKASLKQAS